jgi:transketolase N-terminal domain/subunit
MIGRMLLRQLGVADSLQLRQSSDLVYRVRSDGELDELTAAE